MSFDTAAADLTHRVAEVCDSVYVMAGNPGLTELGRASHGTGRASATGTMLLPVAGRGEPLYLDEQRSPRRHKLVKAFGAYVRELPARRAAMLGLVQSAAAASAVSRLTASQAQVAGEARWTASQDLLQRFQHEPALCWRFRALVESSLAGLHAGEGNVSWRAAQDHLDQEQPGGELAVVATWLGHVALAAGLSGAEPVAAIATVAQLAVDLVKVVVKALAVHEQRQSLDAFLSPSGGFVVDPTYSSLAVDVFWLAVGLWFGRGELRKVLVL